MSVHRKQTHILQYRSLFTLHLLAGSRILPRVTDSLDYTLGPSAEGK